MSFFADCTGDVTLSSVYASGCWQMCKYCSFYSASSERLHGHRCRWWVYNVWRQRSTVKVSRLLYFMSVPTLGAGGVTFLGCPMSLQAYTRGSLSKYARNLWMQYFINRWGNFIKVTFMVHSETNMNWLEFSVKKSRSSSHMHWWLPVMLCLVNNEVVVSCWIWLLRLELQSRSQTWQ